MLIIFFLQKMLVFNPDQRISAREALEHSYFEFDPNKDKSSSPTHAQTELNKDNNTNEQLPVDDIFG